MTLTPDPTRTLYSTHLYAVPLDKPATSMAFCCVIPGRPLSNRVKASLCSAMVMSSGSPYGLLRVTFPNKTRTAINSNTPATIEKTGFQAVPAFFSAAGVALNATKPVIGEMANSQYK